MLNYALSLTNKVQKSLKVYIKRCETLLQELKVRVCFLKKKISKLLLGKKTKYILNSHSFTRTFAVAKY